MLKLTVLSSLEAKGVNIFHILVWPLVEAALSILTLAVFRKTVFEKEVIETKEIVINAKS